MKLNLTIIIHTGLYLFDEFSIEIRKRLLIVGFCTEFNIFGGIIQLHKDAPCFKNAFPKCADHYYSSQAYKCKIFLIIYILFVNNCSIFKSCKIIRIR